MEIMNMFIEKDFISNQYRIIRKGITGNETREYFDSKQDLINGLEKLKDDGIIQRHRISIAVIVLDEVPEVHEYYNYSMKDSLEG